MAPPNEYLVSLHRENLQQNKLDFVARFHALSLQYRSNPLPKILYVGEGHSSLVLIVCDTEFLKHLQKLPMVRLVENNKYFVPQHFAPKLPPRTPPADPFADPR